MKILLLSPHKHLISFLETFGDEVTQTVDKQESAAGFDFIVSYGYRFKITQDMIDQVGGKAVNLHISYLPWNRGADPTFWSVAEDTPRGVTIHMVDSAIDTGPVLAQARYEVDIENDTFRTMHRRASETIEDLFRKTWQYIRNGEIRPVPQLTYHRARDKDKLWNLMAQGWDTPIKDIFGIAK